MFRIPEHSGRFGQGKAYKKYKKYINNKYGWESVRKYDKL